MVEGVRKLRVPRTSLCGEEGLSLRGGGELESGKGGRMRGIGQRMGRCIRVRREVGLVLDLDSSCRGSGCTKCPKRTK